jgi:hypothetical protein
MSALLALLLLLNRGRRGSKGSRDEVGERAGDAVQLCAILKAGAHADEQVGLAEIILGKTPNQILDCLEAVVDLCAVLAGFLTWARLCCCFASTSEG